MAQRSKTSVGTDASGSQNYSPTIIYSTYYGTNNSDTIYTSAISVYYGTIQAGGGNDLVYVGYTLAGDTYNGAYNIYGGDGIDGVDYLFFGRQSGHGVNISLRDSEGQQWGGKYIDVEYVSATQYNDVLKAGNGDSASLYGLDGNDTLVGGANKCLLDGGYGNDTLYGGKGSDKILGGFGDDLVYGGGDGSDYVDGGSGNNILYLLAGTSTDGTPLYGLNIFSYGTYGIVNSSSPNWSQSLYYNFKVVHGSIAGDGYVGSIYNDLFYGEGGNDNIWGGDGLDRLFGGAGSDRIWGENGNDTLDGGNGDDVIYGQAGSDVIYGQAGNDRIYGGQGVNLIMGGTGVDRIEILCKSSYNAVADFQTGKGGDILVMSDLLQMTNYSLGKDINQFLKFTLDNANHAVLNVNIDAAHAAYAGLNVGWNQIATLSNISGILNMDNMLADGNIQIGLA